MVVSRTPTDKSRSHEKFVTVILVPPKDRRQFLNDFRAVTRFDTNQEYPEDSLVDREGQNIQRILQPKSER